MKIVKVLMFFIVFSVLFGVIIHADEIKSGFSLTEINDDDKETFLSNVNFSLIEVEPSKATIQCFDVNNCGLVAIGTGSASSSNKRICVYDLNGNFKYGLSFNCSGGFGIEWSGEDLNVYFVRSDVAVSCDSNGNVKSLAMIENTKENNSYWNHSINATSKIYDNGELQMKNNMGIFNIFATSYSQIVFVDEQGEETIIYDVSIKQRNSTIAIFALVIAFISIVVCIAIGNIIKFKKARKTEDNSASPLVQKNSP